MTAEETIAATVKAIRREQGWSTQQLADRVTELGGKLSRQAISKIENGERRVLLDEVAQLARALNVAPILLILPLGREPMMDATPAAAEPTWVQTWDALKWWIGEMRFPADDSSAAIPTVLTYFRDHDELLGAVLGGGPPERLHDLRKNMRRAGVVPPVLPAGLDKPSAAGS